MPSDALPIARLGLVAFSFFLAALGARLPLEELLRIIQSNSKEFTLLVALIVFLVFLLLLMQQR